MTAKQQVIRIFHEAAIEVQWNETERSVKDCRPPSNGPFFMVIIADAPPKGWVGPDAMGLTLPGSERAYVFFDLVKRFTGRSGRLDNPTVSWGTVLGHAIAHELGHVLIKENAHGAGIMRDSWALDEWTAMLGGVLLFDSFRAKTMRDEITSRDAVSRDARVIDSPSRSRIIVVLCDKIGVNAETQRLGKIEADRILRSAAIDVSWVESTDRTKLPATFEPTSLEGCGTPNFDFDYIVFITAESSKVGLIDPMGRAVSTANYPRAYVFYKRVRAFVADHGRKESLISDEGIILGHVLAHELGHLLMPGQPHTIGGIMNASWGETQWQDALRGSLLFTASQTKTIQSKLPGGVPTRVANP
jgi:hypothetical protein